MYVEIKTNTKTQGKCMPYTLVDGYRKKIKNTGSYGIVEIRGRLFTVGVARY